MKRLPFCFTFIQGGNLQYRKLQIHIYVHVAKPYWLCNICFHWGIPYMAIQTSWTFENIKEKVKGMAVKSLFNVIYGIFMKLHDLIHSSDTWVYLTVITQHSLYSLCKLQWLMRPCHTVCERIASSYLITSFASS